MNRYGSIGKAYDALTDRYGSVLPAPFKSEEDGLWYFWNETALSEGPYETEDAAYEGRKRYIEFMLAPKEDLGRDS